MPHNTKGRTSHLQGVGGGFNGMSFLIRIKEVR